MHLDYQHGGQDLKRNNAFSLFSLCDQYGYAPPPPSMKLIIFEAYFLVITL